jgi:CO dehydrogenase maturation factor
MAVLSKDFLSHLTLALKDLALIDTEAGVEHLGRGVADAVDLILAIIDPSYESIRLSEKILAMADESKKPCYFIINKADGATAEKIAANIGMERVIGIVPFSSSVQEKGLSGEALDAESLDISAVIDTILCAFNMI